MSERSPKESYEDRNRTGAGDATSEDEGGQCPIRPPFEPIQVAGMPPGTTPAALAASWSTVAAQLEHNGAADAAELARAFAGAWALVAVVPERRRPPQLSPDVVDAIRRALAVQADATGDPK